MGQIKNDKMTFVHYMVDYAHDAQLKQHQKIGRNQFITQVMTYFKSSCTFITIANLRMQASGTFLFAALFIW